MKMLIEFSLKYPKLPKDYRRIFIHLFKTALSEANNGKYYDDYYSVGKKKEYTFSVYLQGPVYKEEMVELGDRRGKIYFSTADKKTAFIFFAALMEQRKKELPIAGGNVLQVIAVRQLKEERVRSNSILVKMASPLCVRSHDREKDYDFYYSCEHPDFEKESKRVVGYQLEEAGFSEEIARSVSIVPVNTKKVIVKFYESKIECSLGYFMLEGDCAALNYLLQAGICSRKSAGFGMGILQAEE